jgi:hypothetical protein
MRLAPIRTFSAIFIFFSVRYRTFQVTIGALTPALLPAPTMPSSSGPQRLLAVLEPGVRFQRSRCLQTSIRPNYSGGRPAPAKQVTVLNALLAHIALLDANGVIVVVNQA